MVSKKDWTTYPKGRNPLDKNQRKTPIDWKSSRPKPLPAPYGDGFIDGMDFEVVTSSPAKERVEGVSKTGVVTSCIPKRGKKD